MASESVRMWCEWPGVIVIVAEGSGYMTEIKGGENVRGEEESELAVCCGGT